MKYKSIDDIKAEIKRSNGGSEIKAGDILRYFNRGKNAQERANRPQPKTLPITNKVKILI